MIRTESLDATNFSRSGNLPQTFSGFAIHLMGSWPLHDFPEELAIVLGSLYSNK